MSKRLHLPLLVLPLAALLLLVAGCAEVSRELTISDATAEDLRESLVQQADLPGWTAEEAVSSAGAERALDNTATELEAEGNYVCDLAPVEGPSFANAEETLVVYSTAERVCGDLASYMARTLANESVYAEGSRNSLAANLATYGVSLTNFSYERANLGLDSETHVYEIRADLQTTEGTLKYAAYEVSVYSSRIVTTLYIEGYGVAVPEQDVTRLAGLIRARLNTL
jgi:hypothetical protein